MLITFVRFRFQSHESWPPEVAKPLGTKQERKRRKAEEGETLKLAVFADSAVFLRLTTF